MNSLVPRAAAAVVVACGIWGMSQGTGLPDPTTTEHQPGQRTRAVMVRLVDGDTVHAAIRRAAALASEPTETDPQRRAVEVELPSIK